MLQTVLFVFQTDILYFADICAGPGGFSEYVFWRKTWRAKGFGFTLKGTCMLYNEYYYSKTHLAFLQPRGDM